MSVETSDAACRILELERKIFRLRQQTDDLVTWRVPNTEQSLAMAWALGGRKCTTTITGTIVGGLSSTPMPDVTLQVVGHTSGVDYGTYSVPTGTYNLDLIINDADSSLDLYPFGPASPRFNGATPLAFNRSITRCFSNTLVGVRPPAAPGYGYLVDSSAGSSACQYPIGALNWVDSVVGPGTTSTPVGGSSTTNWDSPCFLGNTFADGVCPAQTGVPLVVGMFNGSQVTFNWSRISFTNQCAKSAACGAAFMAGGTITAGAAITASTCPSFDLTTKFDRTWTLQTQVWHNSVPSTIRFYEP